MTLLRFHARPKNQSDFLAFQEPTQPETGMEHKKILIARRIAQAIREAPVKTSPGKLAVAAGISRQRGYAWIDEEAPTTPSDDQLDVISEITGKSKAWLRGEDTSPEAKPLDIALLARILEVVNTETAKIGLTLPNDKLATIAAIVYSSASITGTVDRSMVTNAILLAS